MSRVDLFSLEDLGFPTKDCALLPSVSSEMNVMPGEEEGSGELLS